MASAWPDQIARARPGSAGVYLLASGRAAMLAETDGLAKSDWLVVADLGGASGQARITLAAPLSEADALVLGGVQTEDRAEFDPRTARFTARRVRAMGAIVLSEAPLPRPPPGVAAKAMLDAVLAEGLDAIGAERVVDETLGRLAVLERARLIEPSGTTKVQLRERAEEWLMPLLKQQGARVPSDGHVRDALISSLDWPVQDALRLHAPLSTHGRPWCRAGRRPFTGSAAIQRLPRAVCR